MKPETHISDEEAVLNELVHTLLYQGYNLFPYQDRPPASRPPKPFGVLYPERYCAINSLLNHTMQTSCIVKGDPAMELSVRVRFLQVDRPGEGLEREIAPRIATVDKLLQSRAACYFVSTPASPAGLKGRVVMQAFPVENADNAFRIVVTVENCTTPEEPGQLTPETLLKQAFVSTHTIMRVRDGQFVSNQNPGPEWEDAARDCVNERTFPVLIGDSNSVMLSSPVILYDYPRLTGDGRTDLFDKLEAEESEVSDCPVKGNG
ncbi:MAG TPA: hypothetical protein VHE54_00980 [Puia sp.]|nr:hypothetical protein [Puia sp.]